MMLPSPQCRSRKSPWASSLRVAVSAATVASPAAISEPSAAARAASETEPSSAVSAASAACGALSAFFASLISAPSVRVRRHCRPV